MPGALLPPFAEPTGPKVSLRDLIGSFLDGTATGFSDEAHIETNQLLLERMVSAAVRLSQDSVLLRRDLPPDLAGCANALESHLRSNGLDLVDPDTRLGDIAAIQTIGIRGGSWDLWGRDASTARRDLERVVMGDDPSLSIAEAPTADGAVGMTLDDLFGEEDDQRP